MNRKKVKEVKKDVRKRLLTEEDYVYCPRFGFSLKRVLEKYPEGLSNDRIAKFLSIDTETLDIFYENTIKKIRNYIEPNGGNEMNYLWFDTETGGLDCNTHTLLTAYFAVCDQETMELKDDLYLKLKPDDIVKLNLSPGAMEVNKINIKKHLSDPNTITYQEGKVKLLEFLNKNKIQSVRKKRHFQPCGHNVQFDKDFIFAQLVSREDWEKIVHYRTLDTSSICSFLKDVGILPNYIGSLTSLVKYFNMNVEDAHDAKGDVMMNIEVYKQIRHLMKIKKEDFAGSIEANLLEIIEK